MYSLFGCYLFAVDKTSRRGGAFHNRAPHATCAVCERIVDRTEGSKTAMPIVTTSCLSEEIIHKTGAQQTKRSKQAAQLILRMGMSVASEIIVMTVPIGTVWVMQVYGSKYSLTLRLSPKTIFFL